MRHITGPSIRRSRAKRQGSGSSRGTVPRHALLQGSPRDDRALTQHTLYSLIRKNTILGVRKIGAFLDWPKFSMCPWRSFAGRTRRQGPSSHRASRRLRDALATLREPSPPSPRCRRRSPSGRGAPSRPQGEQLIRHVVVRPRTSSLSSRVGMRIFEHTSRPPSNF